ncbi:arabinan-endo 1-5-alpha-L-arabinase [Penicillium odoratum]|uniref:arabinan-endo 1-5-alpha-L-arabinase n=1 Tax=Penicillium odoratum TaxID=1167516 RepID=UPI002548F9DE|nr:arabinan-endo 1-5-alpha-L-arabinase [Penicillium odoratum]KAJ5746174.1 arabinan-endo 1-5-alpha-L-arabinase [Penicillium odoratum]
MASTVFLAFALAILRLAASESTRAIDSNFPDPCVIQTNDGYYAFATNGNGVNVQVASSSDFSSWDLMSGTDAMPGPFPSWIASSPAIWAPDVIQRADGTFVMYFSAASSEDSSKHCVGAATSTSITGPYTPENSALACPLDQGGAIDADGFSDGGNYYVVYKIDGNSLDGDGTTHATPIMLQGLNSDAVTPNGGSTQLLDRDDADGPLIEAPSLANVDGTYYLSFSSNMYDTTNYDVSYATASALTGPYTKVQAPDAPLLVSGDPSNVGNLAGPGGADFNGDASKIVFHAFENGQNIDDGRAMYVADISVSGGVITVQ